MKKLQTLQPSLAKQLAKFVNSRQDQIYDKIVQYFTNNPNPDDFDIHEYAEQLGLSPQELEGYIYSMLTSFIRCLGKHNEVDDSLFIQDQLEMGIKEELEHTDSPYIAKLIAKDHLSQDPLYYSHHKLEESAINEPYPEIKDKNKIKEAIKCFREAYINIPDKHMRAQLQKMIDVLQVQLKTA